MRVVKGNHSLFLALPYTCSECRLHQGGAVSGAKGGMVDTKWRFSKNCWVFQSIAGYFKTVGEHGRVLREGGSIARGDISRFYKILQLARQLVLQSIARGGSRDIR